ncbi:MAG: protein kinase [Acidobacteriota bacterium]
MSEAVRTCPACGATMPEAGAAFCWKCGKKLGESVERSTGGRSDARRRVDVRPSDTPTPVAMKDRYRLLSKLGEGGFGEVHKAYDRFLRRDVALKILRGDAFNTERFLEEMKIMAQLEHPAIVPCYEAGELGDGRLYYTMRLLGPRTLRDAIKQAQAGGSFPLKRRLQVVEDACKAIDFGHNLGVVHRDLKPENIMLGEHDEVTLLDFGIAKVLTDSRAASSLRVLMTEEGSILGTIAYAAPEQAAGDVSEIDERSDVFSLGVILYEMLALRLPFQGSQLEMLRQKMEGKLGQPSDVAPDAKIPPSIERACMKALAPVKEHRFASAGDLAREIRVYLDGVAEAEQRSAQVRIRLAEARQHLKEYEAQRTRYDAERSANNERLRNTPPGVDPEAWARVNEETREVSALGQRVNQAMQRVLASLGAAHSVDPESAEPRRLLARFWVDRLVEAELDGRGQDAALSKAQAALYDDGTCAEVLTGDGTLTISTEPPGAEVTIERYVERRDGYLVLEDASVNGTTPVALSLPMGSYLALVKRAGYAEVRYPFIIRRTQKVVAHVRLLTSEEVDEQAFAYVPAMSVYFPADPATLQVHGRWVSIDGFCIARHPVTMGEYLEFLNELTMANCAEAQLRCPRMAPREGYYWKVGPSGSFILPDEDSHGHRHEPTWPVLGVSFDDAAAYAAWRATRDGREYRLPTEDEWEVAARGADGRVYPFGNVVQASFANCALRKQRQPARVTDHPLDVSPFGIFGLCGNVGDLTSSRDPQSPDDVIYKGGNWWRGDLTMRAAARGALNRHDMLGRRWDSACARAWPSSHEQR